MTIPALCTALLLTLLPPGGAATARAVNTPSVSLIRVPDGGIQPQVAVWRDGAIDMVYLKGAPDREDVYFVRSVDGGASFSRPIRVNSVAGSAMAMGNIRGAQLAAGRNGRVHVGWFGSAQAPHDIDKGAPFLYARLNDAGTAFEPERNIMTRTTMLDGGGSVAADASGNVYLVWHGMGPGAATEAGRQVWVARSADDGRTFAPETPAWNQPTGACGCCSLKAYADSTGRLDILYRSATESVNRDMYLLSSTDHGHTFTGRLIDRWKLNACPMSSAWISESGPRRLLAWETRGHVFHQVLDSADAPLTPVVAAPRADLQKYPVQAMNVRGQSILVWTEGMGWSRGGRVAWQVSDARGRPIPDASGSADGVPAWSLVAVFARPDGGFTVVY